MTRCSLCFERMTNVGIPLDVMEELAASPGSLFSPRGPAVAVVAITSWVDRGYGSGR